MSLTGFAARTLDAISRGVRGDLRRELPGSDAMIWPNTLAVIAKVVSMAIHLVELRAEWIYRQIFASTADARQLERHAYEFGLARKLAARATGTVTTAGAADTIYPAGISWLSGATRFTAISDARSDAGGAVVFTVAAADAGLSGNRVAGETMALIDPALAPTLGPTATVDAAGLGGGADAESDASLRARVLDRKRRPPQGGATSDYEQIARASPGVTAAWAHSWVNGPGTVGVWFLIDGRPNGIPTAADVAAVQDFIEARRLIRARLVVQAPIPRPVDIMIGGLSSDSIATRAAIRASLEAMFAARARVGVAPAPFTMSRSWISEAISTATGEDRHVLMSPNGDVTFADGSIPVLGTIYHV